MVIFSKSGQLYGKRRLPEFRQTLVRPGPYINQNHPTLPEVSPPSVDHQRTIPGQSPPEGSVRTSAWPFGDVTI